MIFKTIFLQIYIYIYIYYIYTYIYIYIHIFTKPSQQVLFYSLQYNWYKRFVITFCTVLEKHVIKRKKLFERRKREYFNILVNLSKSLSEWMDKFAFQNFQ